MRSARYNRHSALRCLGAGYARFQEVVEPHYFDIVKLRNLHNARIHWQAGKSTAAGGEVYDLGEYLTERRDGASIQSRHIMPMREADEALNDMILMSITPADMHPNLKASRNMSDFGWRLRGPASDSVPRHALTPMHRRDQAHALAFEGLPVHFQHEFSDLIQHRNHFVGAL